MKRARIPLNELQSGFRAGAFAGLESAGLPAGPSAEAMAAPAPQKLKPGRVVLRRETSGRSGKTVVVVDDFAPHHTEEALDGFLRELRGVCGCGGTRKERTLEIQGDQAAKVRAALETLGFQVAGVK